ncbi:MAG: hypothetical protein JWQ90_35 [Hydrocarboniphaga sp.]|nr:hypothetical protein [Hydrocarboniphaga sp.]
MLPSIAFAFAIPCFNEAAAFLPQKTARCLDREVWPRSFNEAAAFLPQKTVPSQAPELTALKAKNASAGDFEGAWTFTQGAKAMERIAKYLLLKSIERRERSLGNSSPLERSRRRGKR